MQNLLRIKSLALFLGVAILIWNGCVSEPSRGELNIDTENRSIDSAESEPSDLEREFSEFVSQYDDEDRRYWQKPKEVIASLGDISNKVVADIGAGSGYFTLKMLPKAKRVIAIDIDPVSIKIMENIKADLDVEFSKNLDIRMAKSDDPMLIANEADIVFLSNTYTYLEDRIYYFKNLRKKLKPGGKVVIVDFKKKEIPVHPDQESRMALYQVELELKDAGYEIIKSDDRTLLYQYILEAVPRKEEK